MVAWYEGGEGGVCDCSPRGVVAQQVGGCACQCCVCDTQLAGEMEAGAVQYGRVLHSHGFGCGTQGGVAASGACNKAPAVAVFSQEAFGV